MEAVCLSETLAPTNPYGVTTQKTTLDIFTCCENLTNKKGEEEVDDYQRNGGVT
jgi:hypothetical protein